MKKTFKILGGLAVTSAFLLGACDDGNSSHELKSSDSSHSNHTTNKAPLVYSEILNNGSHHYPKVEIAYKDGKKIRHFKIDSSKMYDHIIDDGNKKPYVEKKGDKYHIYRPPYMTYSDDEFEGKVDKKEKVKGE